jgi:UDP-N-acetylglucosamine--N-acetylmuramyl-(pentapeptide) pyrophosphoryl-undecaprenol N-acetylglucosamine transferase
MKTVTLPAVGLVRGNIVGFLKGFIASHRAAQRVFAERPPQAVLAMGGFTSAPPVLAARNIGAATFLHESNTVPGRANRFLARFVTQAFVGFPGCARRLRAKDVLLTGTPVRPHLTPGDSEAARMALGLKPGRETLLIMGGSQGASAINQLVMHCLPDLQRRLPESQFLHLTGTKDFEKVQHAYRAAGVSAVVRPFLSEMDLALSAASVAVSRSGASSLAEFAAMRVPAILIPFPAATDNHQFHNARALVESGAARMLGEQRSTPDNLTSIIVDLMTNAAERRRLANALSEWHYPHAARDIAEAILKKNRRGRPRRKAAILYPDRMIEERAEPALVAHLRSEA